MSRRKLLLQGLSEASTIKDQIEIHFQSRKKSDGGDIRSELNKTKPGEAVIEFEDDEAKEHLSEGNPSVCRLPFNYFRLAHICKQLVKIWKKINFELGLSQADVDRIDVDYGGDVKEKTYQALLCWHRKNTSYATVDRLVTSLENLGRGDLKKWVEAEIISSGASVPLVSGSALPGNHLAEECCCMEISQEVSPDRKFFARFLQMEDYIIRNIENDLHGEPEDKTLELLSRWRKRNGSGATLEVLIKAFEKIECFYLIEKLKKHKCKPKR